jgi:hypothetical protein
MARPSCRCGDDGEDNGKNPSSPNARPETQPLVLAEVADVHQQSLGITKPVALVAEHRPEVCVAGDGIDLSGQLLEEQGYFSKPSVDLVSRLTLRAEGVESSLHRYLPGYESSSRPRAALLDPE